MKNLIHFLVAGLLLSSCTTMNVAPAPTKRLVQFILDGDLKGTSIYVTQEGKSKYLIGELPLKKTIVLKNVPTDISIEYNIAKYEIKPSASLRVTVSDTLVNQYFSFTDIVPLLKEDYLSYPIEVRKLLVSTINAFDTAINSPRMLFASKVSEAKAKLDDLYISYPEYRSRKFFTYMDKLYFSYKISSIVGFNIDASKFLEVAKASTGQLN